MANQPELQGETSDAALEIPADWLMPGIDLDAVREAQRPDTIATLSANHLSLKGVELVVDYRSSAVQVIVRGERREHERRNTQSRRAS
ncbi:MAG: hypothetical protein E6J07_02125 [Chloroflexi bacterium]|nr:MAG: hypothetical protein E6J07_02125 [Chloroflexota bacterium]